MLVLERGEIHVQVEHDASRPFDVHVGDTIVQAVGTAFNIEIGDAKRIELIVTEGKVRVDGRQSPLWQSSFEQVAEMPAEAAPVLVAAGEQLLLGSEREEVVKLAVEEIKDKLSWQGGSLVFSRRVVG